MHMRQCPKFDTCSANLCPLDPDWEKRRHVNGDPICFYMRESVKHGAFIRFLTLGLSELFEACERVRDAICEKWPVIGSKIAESRGLTARLGGRKGGVSDRTKATKPAADHPYRKWRGD